MNTTTGSGRMPDNNRSSQFSPAVIAVIGLLGAAFLLVSYYTMMAKFCSSREVFRRRIRRRILHVGGGEVGGGHVDDLAAANVVHLEQLNGLDQSIIEAIPVLKYGELLEKANNANTPLLQHQTTLRLDDTNTKDYDIHDGDRPLDQCAVCLSDFQRDESVRLLPLCRHAFHVSCIDVWLRSHSNCPLCRSKIIQDIVQDPGQQPTNSPVTSPMRNNNHEPSASPTPSFISAPEGLEYDANIFNNSSQEPAPATTAAVEFAVMGRDRRGAGKSSADIAIAILAQPPRGEESSRQRMGKKSMGLRCFSFERRPGNMMADHRDSCTDQQKMRRSSSLSSSAMAWFNQVEQAQTSIDVVPCRNRTLTHSDRMRNMFQEEESTGPAPEARFVHNYVDDSGNNQHPLPHSSASASSSTEANPRHYMFNSRSLSNNIIKNEVNGGGAAELGSAGPGKSNNKATELGCDMTGRSTMLMSLKGLRSLSGGRLFGFRAKQTSDQIWPDPL